MWSCGGISNVATQTLPMKLNVLNLVLPKTVFYTMHIQVYNSWIIFMNL